MDLTQNSLPAGVVLETKPCPNGCAPMDECVLEGRDRIHGIAGLFRVVRCSTCGLMRTDPRPTGETIGAYYPDDYAPYQSTAPAPRKASWSRQAKARLARWLGRDVRRLPPVAPGRLLEIGCASGAYLRELRDKGWAVEGIEFSANAAATARAAGLTVQTGSVESASPPEQSPDVIAAWMVLEHLHDPVHALLRLREWIKPDGWLVGVVPDASAFDRRLFGTHWYALHLPNHLYHYDPRSLEALFHRAGWQLVQLRWQPNEQNLLRTLEYWLQDAPRPAALRALRWLQHARGAKRLRRGLGWLLGLARQSGRMEFWARPLPRGDS